MGILTGSLLVGFKRLPEFMFIVLHAFSSVLQASIASTSAWNGAINFERSFTL